MMDANLNEASSMPLTVGQQLKAARDARGLTLRDIAGITKMQVSTLECLENDRFDEIHAEVFVRGFLRSYARELRLDADRVLVDYLEQRGMTQAPVVEAAPVAAASPFASAALTRLTEPGYVGRVAYAVSIAALILGLGLSVLAVTGRSDADASAAFEAPVTGDSWRPAPEEQGDWRSRRAN